MSTAFRAVDVIRRKRDGGVVPPEQLREFLLRYTRG